MLDGTFDSAAYLSSKFKPTGRRSFREALLRLEEGEAFINAGQSGADGGGVVVQLIMTLAAQPLPVSLRNEGGRRGPYFMDVAPLCSQMRCIMDSVLGKS